jgi:hypothetical protein
LQRFRHFLFDAAADFAVDDVAPEPALLEIVMKEDGIEQDLLPFPQNLLKPLQNLPAGRLPGISIEAETRKSTLPSSIFTLDASLGNSPKRRKIDHQSSQNITIKHF